MKHLLTTAAIIGMSAVALPAMADDSQTPPNSLVLIENDWILFADQPLDELDIAQVEFVNDDKKRSASHIHRAAAWMRAEANRADDAIKSDMKKSAEELDKLGHDIDRGVVDSAHELRKPLSSAAAVLSRHHAKAAKKAQMRGDKKHAGHYLKASVTDLERAALWSGREVKKGGKFSVHAVREGADKVAEGGGWTVKELDAAIDWTGQEAKKLGEDIKSIGRH